MQSYLGTIVAALAAAAIALFAVEVAHRVIRRVGRRSLLLTELTDHAHRSIQVAATDTSNKSASTAAVRFSARG